jgi:DNA-binding transcriptional MocR family regulator
MRDAILKGMLSPGDPLPPSRELARTLSVSRMTVTVAYERLTAEGFAYSRIGAGTFVSHDSVRSDDRKIGDRPAILKSRAVWNSIELPSAFARPALFDFRTGIPRRFSLLHKAKFVCDWHAPSLAQAALARFIEDGGFIRHIRRVNAVYKERHAIVTSALARDFADDLELVPSSTGLHVTALVREASVDQVAAIARRAAKAGVAIQILSWFAVGQRKLAGVVLGYGGVATNQIQEGLRRLRRCFPG